LAREKDLSRKKKRLRFLEKKDQGKKYKVMKETRGRYGLGMVCPLLNRKMFKATQGHSTGTSKNGAGHTWSGGKKHEPVRKTLF